MSDYAFISFQRHRGNVTIVGIEALPCCKEPSKQFALVEEHITALRKNLYCTHSKVIIFVERNLVSCLTHSTFQIHFQPACMKYFGCYLRIGRVF